MSCLSMSPIKWTSLLGHVECSPEGNTMENNNWWRVSLGGVAPRNYHPTFTGNVSTFKILFSLRGKNVRLASCCCTTSEVCPKIIWKLCVKMIKREYFQTFMWENHTIRKCRSCYELITWHDVQNRIYNLSIFPQFENPQPTICTCSAQLYSSYFMRAQDYPNQVMVSHRDNLFWQDE